MAGYCSTLSLLCLALCILRCQAAERVTVRSLLQQALHSRQARSEPVSSYQFKRDAEAVLMTDMDDVMGLDQESNLEVIQRSMSVQGTQVVKLQEKYKGRIIPDAVVTLEMDNEGNYVLDASGSVIRNIDLDFEESSQLSADEAKDLCIKHNHDDGTLFDGIIQKNEEQVLFDDDGQAYPAYLVQYLVFPQGQIQRRPTCMIDARSSSVISSWDSLDTCDDCRASGVGGNLKMGKIEYGEFHKCLDMRRENDVCYLENKYVRILDNNFTYTDSRQELGNLTPVASYNCVEIDDYINGGYSPLLDALFYGTVVSRLFEDWYGMWPHGNTITLRVHYGLNVINAFWNGLECAFGDSDGVDFHPLVILDVMAHEMAHGITEFNSGLYYFDQWGGINEAFSDMTGEVAEAYIGEADWMAGLSATVGDNPPLRFYEEPERDGRSISHADDYRQNMDVHFSSGVYNHAFYTLVHEYGLPIREVYQVFLHANRLYWHHLSNFDLAACDVMKAAYDLGQDGSKFREAFKSVGIEVCDVEDHVVGVRQGQVYKDITVSRDISPTFVFGMPGQFIRVMTVNATSSSGDIDIILTDKKWGTKQETVDLYARGLNTVTYELVEDVNLYVTINLLTDSVSALKDVTLVAFHH